MQKKKIDFTFELLMLYQRTIKNFPFNLITNAAGGGKFFSEFMSKKQNFLELAGG